ncbi:hypothetical protein LFZ31_25900 [Salmonella enterica subsp. enterica serovar Newport str. S09097]|nr:hypothetical protein LFZ31_25900 [Salmonella enterica subsp. enterica serovar Newport str. S09097]
MQRLVSGRKLYRTEGNIAEHKGVIHLTEQLVNAIHHPRRGAPVSVKRIVRAHFAASLHVGKDIRATKRINRLFRIANQQ